MKTNVEDASRTGRGVTIGRRQLPEPTETEITKSIRQFLKIMGVFCWKQWQGPMSQPKGVADILGIYQGRFLAIEVKRRLGKLSPEQAKFLDRINHEGGIALCARSVDDVIAGLGMESRVMFSKGRL